MKPKNPPPLQRGPAPDLDWATIAGRARVRPGVWYEAARFVKSTNQAWRIKNGVNPAFREGTWDAVTRTEDGTRVLYVCFLGEGK